MADSKVATRSRKSNSPTTSSNVPDGDELHPTSPFYRNNVRPLLAAKPGTPNWAVLQARGFLRAISGDPDSVALDGLVHALSRQHAQEFLCALQSLLVPQLERDRDMSTEIALLAEALEDFGSALVEHCDIPHLTLFPKLISDRLEALAIEESPFERDPDETEGGDEK